MAEDAREHLVEADGLFQRGHRVEAADRRRDMVGDRPRQVQLFRGQLAGLLVIDHELADQAAGGHQRDEAKRADALVAEERQNEAIAGSVVTSAMIPAGDPGLAGPGRMSLDSAPILTGEVAPGAEAHHPIGVEDQDRRSVRTQRALDGVQRRIVDAPRRDRRR